MMMLVMRVIEDEIVVAAAGTGRPGCHRLAGPSCVVHCG